MTTTWWRRHRFDILIVAVLLVVAGLPRLMDLGLYLTADEKNWMGRSYEFIRAFKDFRFNDMLQTSHPGVTTLWTVGTAIIVKMLTSHIPFTFRHLAHFAAAAQLPIALLTTMSVPVMYFFLRRLANPSLALLAALLIALDPFLIGYSRVAHVDALLAHFVFLAVLALLLWRQSNFRQRWLVTAAILSGLALLTKAPAIFLLPFLGLVIITDRRVWRSRSFANQRIKDVLTWLLIVGLLFVIIWPAVLWVPNPEGNVLVLKRDLSIAALTPHHMVEDYTLNPWHYPAALLTRTTPVTLIFSLIFIGVLAWRVFASRIKHNLTSLRLRGTGESKKKDANYELRITNYGLLLAYIFFFILMMTLGAKKGDRYILPVWPALDVFAAAGIIFTVKRVQSISLSQAAQAKRAWFPAAGGKSFAEELAKNFPLGKFERPGVRNTLLLAIPIAYLLFVVYSYHPYAIAYSNPLFPDNLSQELGWGEGLEQVAAWLNSNAPTAVVASWYPEELGAYTSARVAHINAHEQGQIRYVVMYRNMFGRAPDHYANDFIDEYYKKRDPIFIARVAGQEFAWVYEKRVFERVVGELTPNKHIGQEIMPTRAGLIGLDILLATYSGTATRGTLHLQLREEIGGKVLQHWIIPVRDIEDDRWRTLTLDTSLTSMAAVFVEIFAEGTSAGNAPTVRFTRDFNYRLGDMYVSDNSTLTPATLKPGDIALRLRYHVNGQSVHEEETRLLTP